MRRLRIIEIHEQQWFSSELRTAVTDLLQFTLNLTGYARAVAPLLKAALKTTQAKCIVDLAPSSRLVDTRVNFLELAAAKSESCTPLNAQ